MPEITLQRATAVFDALDHQVPFPADVTSLTAAWHGFIAEAVPDPRHVDNVWLEIDFLAPAGPPSEPMPIVPFGYLPGPVIEPIYQPNVRQVIRTQGSGDIVTAWNGGPPAGGPATIWGAGAAGGFVTFYSARLFTITSTDILTTAGGGSARNGRRLLPQGDSMGCRQILFRTFATRPTLVNEQVWAFQIVKDECADWLDLSPGLIRDASAAAGSRTLNTSFGVRIYEAAQIQDYTWITNTNGAPIGKGMPIWTAPAWLESQVPWMGRKTNILVEFFVNGDTIAAGSVIEFALAPWREN